MTSWCTIRSVLLLSPCSNELPTKVPEILLKVLPLRQASTCNPTALSSSTSYRWSCRERQHRVLRRAVLGVAVVAAATRLGAVAAAMEQAASVASAASRRPRRPRRR
jgi:hypothetical protein